LALLAIAGLSVLAVGGNETATATLVDAAKDIVYFAVILVWVGSSRSLRLATGVLVATMASLAALSVIQEFAFANTVDFLGLSNVDTPQVGSVTLRHTGPLTDANFWARALVSVLPIGFSWWALAKQGLTRWLAGGAAITIAFGIYLTQSRGGLIAAVVGVVVWLAMAGRRYARWLILTPVVLAVVLAIPGVGSRLVTLSDISGVEQGAGDPSLQGRLGAQRAGVGMFFDHPILGIGFGEFRENVPEYQRSFGIQAEVLDAHNLYLEIAAETGTLGLLAWGLFLGFGLFVSLRAWLVAGQSGSSKDRWIRLMATGVLSGLVAWLVASAFLHAANLRILYTVLAVGVGLDLWARESTDELIDEGASSAPGTGRSEGQLAEAAGRQPALIRQPAIVVPVILIATVVGSWLLLRGASQEWVAERSLVMATGEVSDWRYEAYSYDLITRGVVGETYAALLEEPEITERAAAGLGWNRDDLDGYQVSTSYAPASQMITVRVSGDDSHDVKAIADAVIEYGVAFVGELDQPFVVNAVESQPTEPQRRTVGDSLRLGLVAVVGTTAVVGIVWSITPARRRPSVPQNVH
jgi:O-antigen ligase